MMPRGHKVKSAKVDLWSEVAAYLQISTGYLRDLRKRDDAPKEPDKEKWLAYKLAKGIGGSGGGSLRDELIREQIRKTRAGATREELVVARERNLVLDRETVDKLLMQVATQQKTELLQIFENELPPKLAGLGAAEIRAELRESAHRICRVMQDRVATWLDGSCVAAQAEDEETTPVSDPSLPELPASD